MNTSLLLFLATMFVSSIAWAANTSIGSYVITEQGKLGVIAGNIAFNSTVAISFIDREKRTEHAENHAIARLTLSEQFISTPRAGNLVQGSFVLIEGKEQEIFEVVAIFRNSQLLVVPLKERLNSRFQPRKKDLVDVSAIAEIIGSGDYFEEFLSRVENNVSSNLLQLEANLQRSLACLKSNHCNFTIRRRGLSSSNDNVNHKIYSLEDFTVTSAKEFTQLLRKQAITYKLYAALANADALAVSNKVYPKSPVSVLPAEGLTPVTFKSDAAESLFAREYVKSDISVMKLFMASFFAATGVKETHPDNIFEKSEACYAGKCFQNLYFGDLVKPLYQMLVREFAQAQPFVAFLNWKLDSRDFEQAFEKAANEATLARHFVAGLKGEERLTLLSFSTSVEQELALLTPGQKNLIISLSKQEEEKKTFINETFREIRKPIFWGMLACYGTAIVTPIKWTHLLCHAAGITFTASSVFLSVKEVRNLRALNKLNLINPEIYSQALISLTVESALAALFIRATLPDFYQPMKGLSRNASAKIATNVAVNVERILQNKRALEATNDHLREVAAKLGLTRSLGFKTMTASILGAFITPEIYQKLTDQAPADILQDGMLSVSEIMSRVILSPQFSLMTNASSAYEARIKEYLALDRETRKKSMALFEQIYVP